MLSESRIKEFQEWLYKNNKKENTVKNYRKAIVDIFNNSNLYGVEDLREDGSFNENVEKIRSHSEFKALNERSHRIEQSALKLYQSFVNEKAEIEYEIELYKEQDHFNKYLLSNNEIEAIDDTSIRPMYREVNNKKIWVRRPQIAQNAIKKSRYQCEVDNNHISFISEITGMNYVEAHHLIPIKYQTHFENSLDVISNIISICPNCHRKLHHGVLNDKKEVLKVLFNTREKELKKSGIEITWEQLAKFYD